MSCKYLKIGDIITSYHKGIYKVTNIEPFYYSADHEIPSFLKDKKKVGDLARTLVSYKKICDLNGSITNTKESQCDIQFCHIVDEYISKEVNRIEKLKLIIRNERDSV